MPVFKIYRARHNADGTIDYFGQVRAAVDPGAFETSPTDNAVVILVGDGVAAATAAAIASTITSTISAGG